MKTNDLTAISGSDAPEPFGFDLAAEIARQSAEIAARGFRVPVEAKIKSTDRYFVGLVVQIGATTGDPELDFARAVEELTRLLGAEPAEVRRPRAQKKPTKAPKTGRKKAA